MRSVILAALAFLATGCGTVDLGTYEGVRDLKLPEDYFYCVVQPQVLTAKKCATGDTAAGDSGCHASATPMRLEIVDTPVACTSGRPNTTPSPAERSNYTAASLRATRNPDASPILVRPTSTTTSLHPRQIFPTTSPEADIIRKWISGAQ